MNCDGRCGRHCGEWTDLRYSHEECDTCIGRFVYNVEDEMTATLEAKIEMLTNALKYVLGQKDDEKIGWRGTGHSNKDMFRCEFCSKTHEDCTLIEHLNDCPITIARNAISIVNKSYMELISEIQARALEQFIEQLDNSNLLPDAEFEQVFKLAYSIASGLRNGPNNQKERK